MPHEVLEHKYIKENPISGTAKALILGTIYPSKDTSEFMCDFFYGNEYTLWGLLKDVFPSLKPEIYPLNKVENGSFKKESADKIKEMLKKHHIAISDTIIKTVRKEDASCSDDKFIESETVYNMALIDQIKSSSIETIFFTSLDARIKFSHIYNKYIKKLIGEKNLPKTFPVELRLKNQGKIGTLKSGDIFYIDKDENKNYFRREIKGVILPSPSGRATGCNKHEEAKKETGIEYPDWRKDFYKREFGPYLG